MTEDHLPPILGAGVLGAGVAISSAVPPVVLAKNKIKKEARVPSKVVIRKYAFLRIINSAAQTRRQDLGNSSS